MNNKILLTIATLLVSSFTIFSQTTETIEEEIDSVPRKKFTVAATVGYNTYTTVFARPGFTSVSPSRGSTALNSEYMTWSDSGLYVGVEGGYFVSDKTKLTLELGFNHTYRPGYLSVPGVNVGGHGAGGGSSSPDASASVPSYSAVPSQTNTTYRIVFGVNRYNEIAGNLSFYYGGTLGLSHGISSYKVPEASSQGNSTGESLTTNVAGVTGIEYSFSDSPLYFAIQTNALNYSYNVTSVKPVPGVTPLKADAHSFSFIGYPSVRIGFTF